MLELVLVQLDDADITSVPVRRNGGAERGCPADEADNPVLGLAPPLLDVDKELLERVDLGVQLGELGLVLIQLGLGFLDVDPALHPVPERSVLLLERLDRVDVCANEGLDRGEVVREGARSHHKDLLLRSRFCQGAKVRMALGHLTLWEKAYHDICTTGCPHRPGRGCDGR